MAKARLATEPELPWVEYDEDRGFRWMMIIMLVIFMGAGVFLNLIKLPEVAQKNLIDVSPRLAKLILEKQKVKPPPPPPPKKEKPKEEVKKKKEEPKKKEAPKKKEEPKKKEKPKKKKEAKKPDAREVAKKSGLIALSDELADLRESFDLDEAKQPQQTAGKQAIVVATSSDLLTATAGQSSGGIKTDTLNRNLKTSELAQRKTTRVESKIESDEKLAKAAPAKKKAGSGGGKRSASEIERVFQKNKGSIFNLYNRALRKNPSLAGKLVVELTISPAGQVTAVKIISSELGDKKLERKLVLSIKKFKFARSNVAETIIVYPIDFLPS